MSIYKDDMRDDTIRIIGAQSRKLQADDNSSSIGKPTPPKQPKNKWLLSLVILAILLISGLIILLRQGKTKEDPYDGVFEPKQEISLQPEKKPLKQFGHEDNSSSGYTERIDTVINDISLSLLIPHKSVPELIVGKAPFNDKDVILAAQAADIRADNKKILGAFVYKGEPLAWGLSKKGFCAIIDGEITVGTSENSPLFEKATETKGYFFRQFPLVNNGQLEENELKNKIFSSPKGVRLLPNAWFIFLR